MLRLPVALRGGRPVVMTTGPLVSARREGEEPETGKKRERSYEKKKKKRSKRKALRLAGRCSEVGGHHLPSLASSAASPGIRRLSSSDGRTMPLSLCSPWKRKKAQAHRGARLFGNLPLQRRLTSKLSSSLPGRSSKTRSVAMLLM